MTQLSRDELLAALKWQIEAGADEAVAEEPLDRYRAKEPERPRPAAQNAPRAAAAPRAAPERRPPELWRPEPGEPAPDAEEAMRGARELAQAAKTLEELNEAIRDFEGCPLKATAMNTVIADGNPDSKLMLIGEAPGANEDRQGLPFVGDAGRLLDEMLAGAGYDRTKVYITNVLFWRPPGNRTPSSVELGTCLPFVERHIELAAPDYLMFLGATPTRTLLGEQRGITRIRGQWFAYQHAGLSHPIPAQAALHPAYLLRQPAQKRYAWADFLNFVETVESGANPLT